jgi:hypothetical protein
VITGAVAAAASVKPECAPQPVADIREANRLNTTDG